MNRLFYILAVVLIFSACDKKAECVENPKSDCFCITLYDPVCGCNDVTYGNSCEAGCAGIGDYTNGPCAYNVKPLVGKWNFLGYESEGARFKSDKKTHKYEMYLELEDDKVDNNYKLTGKSAVNFFGGYYEIANLKKLNAQADLNTKIAGSEIDLAYEYKFVDFLSGGSFPYEIDGDYLKIESTSYSDFGPAQSATLIFRKD